MRNLFISHNYFIQVALGFLRDKDTDTAEFRSYAKKLISHLISESLSSQDLEEIAIWTDFQKTKAKRIKERFVLIPILRAGIAMLNPVLELLPDAAVGFAGLVRDEKTAIAREYYWKVPPVKDKVVLILDPMLATGGSITYVLRKLKDLSRPKEIRIINVVASPEGVEAIHKEFPEVKIFTASLDEKLNDKKFILPGLGDFGDRFFKTESINGNN